MQTNLFKIILIIVCIVSFNKIYSQTIPVGSNILEDTYRREQLLGTVSLSASFTSRPFHPYTSIKSDYFLNNQDIQNDLSSTFMLNSNKTADEKAIIKILPITWRQQFVTDHPTGLNDGAMIPAAGYQTMLTGGVFAKYSFISIQLKPEFVFAQNKDYQGFFDENTDKMWQTYYYNIFKFIDTPEKFGNEKYFKAFWGQSSIRLTFGPISFGLSNENLWWGPGMKNSLLMTNNAPGFKHITFNTVKPIKTFIGSFEGQLVGGRLDGSGYTNIDTLRLKQHGITFTPKTKDWRYFNGIVLSYQPKWIPGLFLGATRSFIRYSQNLTKDLNSYLPVIIPLFKKTIGNSAEDSIYRDQLASIFVRWVMPESNFEVYAEYGHEDHNYDLVDLIQEPNHSAAYVLGFRKLISIKTRTNEFIDIQFEHTDFTKSLSDIYRLPVAWGWYQHHAVVDGYTHNGQYLGAGIGGSSNMQTLNISWVKNLKRIGVEFKRLAHDENFWAYALKDYVMHWTDIAGSVYGEWNFGRLLLDARVETTGSWNYQWYYNPENDDPYNAWDRGKMRVNVHAELGVTYCF